MKTVFAFLSAVLLAATGAAPFAAEKFRVIDRGLDGNQRIYLVTCPSGHQSSVIQTFSVPDQDGRVPDNNLRVADGRTAAPGRVIEVCIYPSRGKESCRPAWAVDEAARASCR